MAAVAGKMAGIYAIQAMESAEGAVDAPAGTEAETVVPSGSPDRPVVLGASRAHGGRRLRLRLLFIKGSWAEISHDLEDDAVMGLVDRAVAAGMGTGAAARPVVCLSKMAREVRG